jgi:uncharacterized BrkB/YihY/UPF0761 family membrane protein
MVALVQSLTQIVPDDDDKRFVRGVYVVREGFLTLVDVILLAFTTVLLLAFPYRLVRLKRRLKAIPGPEWRSELLKMWIQVVIDLPYILMFAALIIVFPAGWKLKKSIQRK